MVFDRFLSLTKSRRLLTLLKSSDTKHVVPRLRDVKIKTNVHISSETLLDYQHDLRTNSTFFNIILKLNPVNTDVSALQQYFIVNGLSDEFMLELDYDSSIVSAAENSLQKEALLVEHAEKICNEKISRELRIAEKLLKTEVKGFFDCVAEKVDRLLQETIGPEQIEGGDLPLVEKSSNVYLEWFALIEPCIAGFVEKSRIDGSRLALESPFEMIDLSRIKVLGALFGQVYEGNSPWISHAVQTRKYHVGSVRICPSEKISEEYIKRCLAHCAASFFTHVATSPLGQKFQDAAAEPQQKYIEAAREYHRVLEKIRRKHKTAAARKARNYANLLVQELGSEAERLKLAMEHDLDFVEIYYDTLSNHLRDDIETALTRGLGELYASSNIEVSSSIDFANGSFSRDASLGEINSPELLTLRVSQIVKEYFASHPWLFKLNVKKPDIFLLAAHDTASGGNGQDEKGEFVLISNFFPPGPLPKNSNLIIDIKKISFAQDQVDEMVTLHRV